MAVALFIAAIVAAWHGNWWLVPFLVAAAIACAADTIERDRTDRRISQLRRRQLDQLTQDPRTDSHPPD